MRRTRVRGSGVASGWAIQVVVGLLALTGPVPAARAAPRSCETALSVTPSTIPAGTRKARITIPAGLTDVQLRSSSGSVTSPVRSGAGAMVAEFTAAPESPPVVLVAAVGPTVCGSAVLRIAWEGLAPARGMPVSLVLVDPRSLTAAQEGEVLVYVFAVDDRGIPRSRGVPSIHAAVGSVTGVEMISRGVWRGRLRVPAGEAIATTVEAGFDLEPRVTASLARAPGDPVSIQVTHEPPGGAAGAGALGAVVASIRDSAGNLTEASLALESEEVLVGAPVRIDRGVYRAPLEARPGTRGNVAVVAARAGAAVGTTSFIIAPPAAAVVRVIPPGPIRSDRSSSAQIEVVVTDASGVPVAEVPVGSGGAGEFGEAFPLEPGHWTLPYRPPRVLEDTTERVVVKAGAASTTADLRILARDSRFSLGLKAGAALAGGRVGPAAGVEFGVWALVGEAQLGLVLGVDWWMLTERSTVTIGGVPSGYEGTQNYVPLLLSLAWRAPIGERWLFWATGGGGGAWVQSQAQAGAQAQVLESGFAPAASGSLSAGPRLGPGSLFLEVRGTWVGDPQLSTLSGSSFTLLGLLGFRFDVG